MGALSPGLGYPESWKAPGLGGQINLWTIGAGYGIMVLPRGVRPGCTIDGN